MAAKRKAKRKAKHRKRSSGRRPTLLVCESCGYRCVKLAKHSAATCPACGDALTVLDRAPMEHEPRRKPAQTTPAKGG